VKETPAILAALTREIFYFYIVPQLSLFHHIPEGDGAGHRGLLLQSFHIARQSKKAFILMF